MKVTSPSMPAMAVRQSDGMYRLTCSVCKKSLATEVKKPENFAPLVIRHEAECPAKSGFWLFDNPETKRFTEARMEFLTPLLRELRRSVGLESALDVGCGLGDFSGYLRQFGIHRVLGVDGRAENVAEAQRRFPEIPFQVADAEELSAELGSFDLVLCFGLLYHLKNPFRAIEKLHALTGKVLLIESMCVPGNQPKLELLDESPASNQGLSYVAFYPSEPALVKMLTYAGFPFVYGFPALPQHPLYRASRLRNRLRTVLLASRTELPLLRLHDRERKATPDADPWRTVMSRLRGLLS